MENAREILEYELIDICIDSSYSITVPTPHTPFLDDNLKINSKSKKRKKRSK